jgi:hypothetical protein
MNRKWLVLSLIAVVGVGNSGVLGQQQAGRMLAARQATASPGRAAPPNEQSGAAGQAEPYMMRPGVYVIPGPYSPTYWSPTLRPALAPGVEWYGWTGTGRSLVRRGGALGGSGCGPSGNCGYQYQPGYGWVPFGGDWQTGYELGRYDAEHDYVWYIASQRAGELLNQWREQFESAILDFRAGRYEQTAISMLGAAEKNNADGACRLHAGHALFALGRYEEAVPLIERAFELAPSLAYKLYDIRDEYGDRSKFEEQLKALESRVASHPNDAAAVTLLGYVKYYSAGPSTAYPCLARAAKLNPKSYFIPKLLGPARMVRRTDAPPATVEQKATIRQEANPPRGTEVKKVKKGLRTPIGHVIASATE